jgi:hypothetical protein
MGVASVDFLVLAFFLGGGLIQAAVGSLAVAGH